MGFCKPGDPCFQNEFRTNPSAAAILAYQQESLAWAERCLDMGALGNFCQEVRDCVTGDTHHSLTACTIYVDVIHPCTTGTTFMGDVIGVGDLRVDETIVSKDFKSTYVRFFSGTSIAGTTLIGYNAGLDSSSGGGGNTMVGQGAAGFGEWMGCKYNTSMGYNSLAYLTEGNGNTAVGYQSIATITTASNNTAMGYQAGYSQTTDSNNTVIGFSSHAEPYGGGDAGLAANNVAVGYLSMNKPNRGYKNVAVGSEALKGNSTFDLGSQNSVAIGYKALYASRTGTYNVALGYQAGIDITTGSYNISIGPDADVTAPTESYQMNIGNIIYGKDVGGGSSINTIGIGTSTPNEKLTVVGAVSATSQLYFSEIDGGSF